MGYGKLAYETGTYFNTGRQKCDVCNSEFEECSEDADSIESNGACLDCAFETMLQGKEATVNVVQFLTPKRKMTNMAKVKYSDSPISEVPTDFNPSSHESLTTADFVEEALFWDWRAFRAQMTVDKMLAKAKDCREFGSPEKRAAKKKLESMAKKMAEMEAKLSEQIGEDEVAALMEAIKAG